MKINLLAFGIAKDILGESEQKINLSDGLSIADLKNQLSDTYPAFKKLSKFDIAVNQEYRDDHFQISDNDEVAIIPPVSGG